MCRFSDMSIYFVFNFLLKLTVSVWLWEFKNSYICAHIWARMFA